MAKVWRNTEHNSVTGTRGKKTHIGRGNVGYSTMPKRKKETYKKYRGQGKWLTTYHKQH